MKEIHWSEYAQQSFENTVKYLFDNFGENISLKFIKIVYRYCSYLLTNPEIGKPLNPREVEYSRFVYHTIVIHHRCRLVYYISERHIVIVAVWDTRRDIEELVNILGAEKLR